MSKKKMPPPPGRRVTTRSSVAKNSTATEDLLRSSVENLNDAAAWEEGNKELVAVRKIPLRRRISLLRDLNY